MLAVIVLFALLLAPFYMDWQPYKTEFEKRTSALIGVPVKVNGKTDLQFFPLPAISFENMVVGEADNGSKPITIDQFEMTVELLPFLSGELQIVEINVDRPAGLIDMGGEKQFWA